MGADHIERLTRRIAGAEVSVVVDADISRAKKAVEVIPSAVAVSDIGQALDRGEVNAVLIATPGFLHRDMLLQVREQDLPILCEKPLTPDAPSSWEILEAEQRLGKKRIQVGFMRRFDAEYQRLRAIITSGDLGDLLTLHCSHRVPETPHDFTNEMLINDAVVHEFDVIRYLTGEEIKNVQVRLGRASRHSHSGQHDPQHVLLEIQNGVLADVKSSLIRNSGTRLRLRLFSKKVLLTSVKTAGLTFAVQDVGERDYPDFRRTLRPRFRYRGAAMGQCRQIGEAGGPTAWDGYATAARREAGVAAQQNGEKVGVSLKTKPSIHRNPAPRHPRRPPPAHRD